MHQLLAAAAGLITALSLPAVPAAAEEPAVCHVAYQRYGDSRSFAGRITITNTGPDILYGWTLKFPLPAPQTFRTGWEADFTVDGADVTGLAQPHNSVVGPNGSVAVWIYASGDVNGPRPAEFRINDHRCTTS
jgi:hypothetical protein